MSLIQYRLIFIATGCLLYCFTRYIHIIFIIPLILYLIYIFRRFNYIYVLLIILLCLCIHTPLFEQQETIKGSVYKVFDQYVYVSTANGNIKLYTDETLHYKDDIECSVTYSEINESKNDYGFNEKQYLASNKIFMKAYINKLISVKSHKTIYSFLESRLSKNDEVNSYQRLLVLGEKDDDIKEDYSTLSNVSIVHMFALSGLHLHILYIFLFTILTLVCKEKTANIIILSLLGIYVLSIPVNISLLRAYFILLLSHIFKDYLNQLDLLSILCIISLIYNPYIIFNLSFIFSYFIYFIVLITKNMKYQVIWIYLASIPVILYVNHSLSILSVLLSALLSPYISVFYCLTHLALYFSIFNLPLIYCVNLLKVILQFIEHFNLSFTLGHPTLSFTVLYYFLYFIILYLKEIHFESKKVVLILLALCISFSIYGKYKTYGEITMINVGQGDCTLIHLPFNKGNILVDTGGNINYDIATSIIIPYLKSISITSLDYVYISHDDEDHCGALESLVENFNVKNVIREYCDDQDIYNIHIHMFEHSSSSEENDNSLIMKVTFNSFSVLFTGDASTTLEEELVNHYGDELKSDILKVGHHGSKTSTSATFLNTVSPTVAMIGVGKNNKYGHPNSEVIQRLERKNITILRTDETGMFHIRYDLNGYYIIE